MVTYPCALLLVIWVSTVSGFFFSKPSEVCYHGDGIGCFTTESPHDNFIGYLPESPAHIQIKFRLYTDTSSGTSQIVTKDASSILASSFDGTKNTKFIIHGYGDRGTSEWVLNMVQALLSVDDVNVFTVDWEKGADNGIYIKSACNTQVVGALLAQFITALHTTSNAPYNSFHVIGHSLGAHAAGFAGARISGLGRISGMDPAGPLFEAADPRSRLDPTDADFVDAIHTDSRALNGVPGFGIGRSVGHVDFYPNGGDLQPGCANRGKRFLSAISNAISGLKNRMICSHMRVIDFYTESVTSTCSFKSYPCGSYSEFAAGNCNSCGTGCSFMGYNSDQSPARGVFYLITAPSSPYCQL